MMVRQIVKGKKIGKMLEDPLIIITIIIIKSLGNKRFVPLSWSLLYNLFIQTYCCVYFTDKSKTVVVLFASKDQPNDQLKNTHSQYQ